MQTEQFIPRKTQSSQVVSWEEYMDKYAADGFEWVEGTLIPMSPTTVRHNNVSQFLEAVFKIYCELTGGGMVLQEEIVMRLERSSREPDLMVILPENFHRIKETYLDGPADLVVEIMSPESDTRDRVDKFKEYNQGGVREYWIVDSAFQEVLFYQPDESGVFQRVGPDDDGIYHSAVLPRLRLKVALLWEDVLPNTVEVVEMLKAQLSQTP